MHEDTRITMKEWGMSVYEVVQPGRGGTVRLVEHTVGDGSLPVGEPA